MLRNARLALVASLAMTLFSPGFSQAQGTGPEAKAMLEKAVAAVKSDKAKAIDMFNKGEGGFKDRDLYPFCFQTADGKILAAPERVRGQDVRTLKDPAGKAYGEELYKAASQEGTVNEVSYQFPKPGASTPSPKTSFVTKAGDLGCGVGIYK
jgi:signal transduction histidine kinase